MPEPGQPVDRNPTPHYTPHLPEQIGSAIASVPLARVGPAFHMNDEEYIMARRCELTGKGVLTGNNVSHANNKSRRRFLPNLKQVSLISDALERTVHLRISMNALRSVEHRGGLDAFMAKANNDELSPRAKILRKEIMAKRAETAAADAEAA